MIPRKNWTKEKCHEEALKCETRSEFIKSNGSAYQFARKMGWKTWDSFMNSKPKSSDTPSIGAWLAWDKFINNPKSKSCLSFKESRDFMKSLQK